MLKMLSARLITYRVRENSILTLWSSSTSRRTRVEVINLQLGGRRLRRYGLRRAISCGHDTTSFETE